MFQNLVIVMSLSGALILLFWLVIHRLYFLEFKAEWLHNMILMAIPFFLLPVPLLRNFFSKPLVEAGIMPASLTKEIEGVLDKTYIALSQGDIASLSSGERKALLVMGVAILTSCIFILRQAHSYLKLCWAVRYNVRLPISQQEKEQLTKTKYKMQMNKEIGLIKSSKATAPFTMGLIHPVIVIPEDLPASKDALFMIFAHELAHIKHKDSLFTFISCIIWAMHWFNPFCIIYLRSLKEAAELYSDETVMEMLPDIDKLAYCHLLIQLANKKDAGKCMFTLNFSSGSAKRQLQRRIDNIIKGKKQRFKTALAFGCLMFSVGLGSTLLYSGVDEVEIANAKDIITSEKELCFNYTNFQMEDISSDFTEATNQITYDTYFVDENNNIFPFKDSQPSASCTHSYVNGTVKSHIQNGKECTINYYHAKRCKICGNTITYDLYYSGTWPTCPHQSATP